MNATGDWKKKKKVVGQGGLGISEKNKKKAQKA
jgi:hypothetical protein